MPKCRIIFLISKKLLSVAALFEVRPPLRCVMPGGILKGRSEDRQMLSLTNGRIDEALAIYREELVLINRAMAALGRLAAPKRKPARKARQQTKPATGIQA